MGLIAAASSEPVTPWVDSFCCKYGSEVFLRLPRHFICDPVVDNSLYMLVDESPLFEEALKLLGGLPSGIDASNQTHQRICEQTYCALHARFVTATEGLMAMRDMVEAGRYGSCPRVLCLDQRLIPMGLHDVYGKAPMKLFCSCCKQVYHAGARYNAVDGAAFGTSLPHLLLLRCRDIRPTHAAERYEPKVFGFKVKQPSPTRTVDNCAQ
jgi:casein kinase II subunit beta